jgi:acetolactate synthase-1/2/3 large subunit
MAPIFRSFFSENPKGLPRRVVKRPMQSRNREVLAQFERAPSSSIVVPAKSGAIATVSDALVDVLVDLGVREAFGIFGGAIAPFCEAVHRSPIDLLHFRHEAGAAFAAIETSLAADRLTVVFATSGPGLTNTITGMAAARWEGAKVLFVTGATGAAQRGKGAFQETSAYTMPVSGLFTAGPLFHHAALVDSPAELETIASRLAIGIHRPGGFVAHLGLPIAIQTAIAPRVEQSRFSSMGPPACDPNAIDACVRLLASAPFVVWLGYGARRASKQIRAFVERTGARVMCSPRAKGIFPEDHPQYLGVTGLGGHAAVEDYLRTEKPARALVLGSRLGEFTSFWNDDLVPSEGLMHVDVDPEAFGMAYPASKTVSVQAEIGAFVSALLASWPEHFARPRPALSLAGSRERAVRRELRDDGPVRPRVLMETIQEVIVEGSDAIVLTEAGNSFTLGSHYLRFADPGRYRVSSGFGSMGHAVGGVLGAALAGGKKAVAIAGDGAMLMSNEMSTAVSYGIDAVWIVLNDARYGMIEQGMRAIKWEPFETDIPRADFVMIARGMGADGIRVEREADLEAALEQAMRAKGPFVVDVWIDPTEAAPPNRRNASLLKQGVNGQERTRS